MVLMLFSLFISSFIDLYILDTFVIKYDTEVSTRPIPYDNPLLTVSLGLEENHLHNYLYGTRFVTLRIRIIS